MLGVLLERVVRQPLAAFAQQVLFTPLGVTDAKWQLQPLGTPMTGGGLQLTTRDLWKFGQLYLDQGQWEGRKILSADWVRRSVAPHANARPDTDYGYLWWLQTFQIGSDRVRTWGMYGTGGNKVYVLPDYDAVVIITTTNYRVSGAHALTDQLFEAIFGVLGGQ